RRVGGVGERGELLEGEHEGGEFADRAGDDQPAAEEPFDRPAPGGCAGSAGGVIELGGGVGDIGHGRDLATTCLWKCPEVRGSCDNRDSCRLATNKLDRASPGREVLHPPRREPHPRRIASSVSVVRGRERTTDACARCGSRQTNRIAASPQAAPAGEYPEAGAAAPGEECTSDGG